MTGRHHGIEGFREFSNPRGLVVRGTGDLADVFLPQYGPLTQAIVDSVFEAAAQAGPAASGAGADYVVPGQPWPASVPVVHAALMSG